MKQKLKKSPKRIKTVKRQVIKRMTWKLKIKMRKTPRKARKTKRRRKRKNRRKTEKRERKTRKRKIYDIAICLILR